MKTLFQIKETSASSVRHCCRVLSLIVVGLVLSSTASAKTYYIDASSFKTGLVVPFVQTQKSVDMKGSVDLTTGLITTKDFTFSTEDAGKLKFKLEWADAGICHVENISSTDIGDFDCIKILKSGANNISASAAVSGGYIQFTNHGSPVPPGPTPGGDVLPVLSTTVRGGDLLHIYVEGMQSAYLSSDTWEIELIDAPSGVTASRYDEGATGEIMYQIANHTSITGPFKFRITDVTKGKCAEVTMNNGSAYTSHTSCSASPTPEVSITSVDAGNGQLTVNWSVTGITPTSQTVQYKAGTGAYQNVPAVSASATSATITGLTNGTEYTIKVTATDGTDSPSAEQTGTPAAPTPGGGVIPITSSTKIKDDQLWIYIDGYPNNEYKMTNDYVITGTRVKELQDKGGSYLYVVLTESSASGTHEFKIQDNTTNTCAKFTITNGSYDSHQSCIEPTETPIVYWEKYPTIGNNTIDMFGYLAERWCSPVTDAGFYWKETNDITASDIETPAAANHKFPAAANPAKNNDSFSKTTPDLSTIITEPTTIYLVNYVTTAGGGTGISDVVALAYSPCFPIPDGGVTFNNDEISLPQGYKFTFEVTARSAGKTPVYKWYLDDALIEGAASNTYEFTMPNTDPHTIKVEVTGDCEVSREATASITSCTMPAVTLAAETSTTPWTDVIITATPTAVASAEWSVEPKAELSGTSTSGATFRAGTPGTYTVKYVGASSACDATVNAEAEIEITVNADSEDCVNPNAE